MNNLPQTYESVVKQRDALEKKLADIAAEAESIKSRMQLLVDIVNNADNSYCMCGSAMKDHGIYGCGSPTGMFDYHYGKWIESEDETPATDAFMAEVRAQVWIEGNEPAEFGRYWVRYETDVGPQYCSAKWMEHNFCAGSDTNIHKIWLSDHSRSINSLKGVTHYTMLPEPIEGGAK